MSPVTWFIIGTIAGIAVAAIGMVAVMRSSMLVAHPVSGKFEDVVEALKKAVPSIKGWGLPIPPYKLSEAQASKGLELKNINKAEIYFVCNSGFANKVLNIDWKIAGMMPCSWAVVEHKNGQVYIIKMNIGLMSKMFPSTLRKLMGTVAEDEEKMLKEIEKLIK